jgi:polysaccharide export outer membrane protein
MRLIRSFILMLGVATAAAGCAQRPVAWVAYPAVAPASGIDNMVYGSAAPAQVRGGYAVSGTSAMPGRGLAMGGPFAPVGGGYVAAPPAPVGGTYMTTAPGGYMAPPPAPVGGGYAVAAPPSPALPPPVPVAAPAEAPLFGYAAPVAPAPPSGGYTLDSGDRMRIVVFGQDGLTNSYIVGAGGAIDMPLIGSVGARGLTTEQLAARISEKLRQGYIREPHVAVEIESYRPFFILGEVTAPGQYPFVANMTVETGVAIAGGFSPRALRKTVVLSRIFNGEQVRMTVPVTFPLRPGDTISVQERWF